MTGLQQRFKMINNNVPVLYKMDRKAKVHVHFTALNLIVTGSHYKNTCLQKHTLPNGTCFIECVHSLGIHEVALHIYL